jgi:hypothetical protein
MALYMRDVCNTEGEDWRTMWFASGVRATDSLRRKLNLKKYGSAYPVQRMFYPVYDWKDDDVEREIRAAGVPLGREYRFLPRTWECTTEQMDAMELNAPEDYQRILRWFPLMRAEKWRRTYAQRPSAATRPAAAEGGSHLHQADSPAGPRHRGEEEVD